MPQKPQKQPPVRTSIIILSLLAVPVLLAIYLNKDYLASIISPSETQQVKQDLPKKIIGPEVKTKELTTPPADITPKLLANGPAPLSIDFSDMPCAALDEEIQRFFSYLDKQQYISAYNLKTGSQAHFQQLIDKLLANPPIVVRETDSLFTILTNTAHFYRVLGKDNVLMVKDITLREGDILESTFALFDQWAQTGNRCQDAQTKIVLPLPKLYEYAGFFLNTLGGQAYLFRRDSHLRLLIKYYCVKLLDRANAEVINRHGIDIIPPLESLINEIEISQAMTYKEQYLRTLRELQNKYQTQYSGT
jgi:hypothetical protein